MPHGAFFDQFKKLSTEEILEINGKYEPIEVTVGDEPITSLKGYSNGMAWNGWEMPAFTKETLDNEIANGTFFGPETGYILTWHEPVKSYLLVTTDWGPDAPLSGFAEVLKAVDLKEAIPSVPSDTVELKIGNYNLQIDYVHAFDAMIDGEIKTLYAVGDGWTWELAETPDQEPEASTPGL